MVRRHNGTGRATVQAMHDRFALAYIAHGENATRAMLAVKPHLTQGSAGVEGHRLLKVPRVQQLIERHRLNLRARFSLTTDRVLQELARLAYFNPANVLDGKGKPKALHEIDQDTAAALTLEMDGDRKVLRIRTPAPAAKNTAVRQAVRILRLEDRPPPPPPDPTEGAVLDQRDLARRMAFLLAQEDHQVKRDRAGGPKPVKKKVKIAA